MELLDKILTKYNFSKRTSILTVTIEEIERNLQCQLPDDYKYFLENYTEFESTLGPEYLRLWDIDNILERNLGYEIQEWLENTIGIGTNGGAECIAIEFLNHQKYRIILTPFIFDKECHIEIGTSFTDMLVRLDNGIVWFK